MKKFLVLLQALLIMPLIAHAADEGDLLEPEKAFALSAKVVDGKTIEVRYQIANGYYLYHEKFKFQSTSADVVLGAPQIPPGKVKQDEFFGKVETHRGNLLIKIPVNKGSGTFNLKAISQGCADAGVCYPPLTQTVRLSLGGAAAAAPSAAPAAAEAPTPAPAPKSGGALTALKDLGLSLGGGGDDLLPAEQAMKATVVVKDANTLTLTVTPSANVYLYRDKIKATLLEGEGVTIAGIDLPSGEDKEDPAFGKIQVYHQVVQAHIKLQLSSGASQKIALRIDFQGCNGKIGVCYPPQNKRFELQLPAGAVTAAAEGNAKKGDVTQGVGSSASAEAGAGNLPALPSGKADVSAKTTAPEDEESKILNILKNGSVFLIFGTFLVIGLGLSFTPCVFPMIPILSGIIAGQGQSITKSKGFILSLAYVLGMAITYTIAGVIAGKSGALLSSALQNPWVLGGFAMVFVALSFSMFGFYELQMPNFIQSRLTESSNKLHGGNLGGVFVMGVLSALIVGPCVAAPLAGTLLFISQTGDGFKGGLALFAMAMGMGAPLLAMGVGGGSLLPRAGGWMNAVKSFFGVMLLGVAIWLISPVISAVAHMLLWAALLIVSAIYLHALDPLPPGASGFKKFWKGVGVIALVTGVAMTIGALSGGRDVLQPLAGLRAGVVGGSAIAATAEHGLKFERIKSVEELDARITAAKGKTVMLDFFADWCVSCKEMEKFTFTDAKVQARLKDTVLLQADVTANSDADKALLKRFRLFGPPGIIFFDRNGAEQKYRVIGYQKPEQFLQSLESVLK